jgi:undecaprenyl-diphosphatase
MLFEFVEDITKLVLVVACLYLALRVYARRRQPAWSEPIERRRLGILWLLVLAVSAIKLSEDVLGGESGPIDNAVLVFIRGHVPDELMKVFEAMTLTGSSKVLFPLTMASTIALLLARHRIEALLLASSVITAAIVVYVVKALVGRDRPALWQTESYWGSSFPSGHTLVVAAFATASALVVSRLWPDARRYALTAAFAWVVLVALSRLVLGVHWPTDVLVAACIGACLPLSMDFALELHRAA